MTTSVPNKPGQSKLSKAQQMLAQLEKADPDAFNNMMESIEDELNVQQQASQAQTVPGPAPRVLPPAQAAVPPNPNGCAGCGGPLAANGGCPACMGQIMVPVSCPVCNGQCGTGQGQLCTNCNGTGFVNQPYNPSSPASPAQPPAILPDEELDYKFTNDDLIDMLDLDARDAGYNGEMVESDGLQGLGWRQLEEAGPSVTALSTDKWTRRRGMELKNSEWNGIDPATGIGLPKADEFELADAYSASYEICPTVAKQFETVDAKMRAQWYSALLKSDDFQASRHMTIGDMDMAEIGAESITESWIEYKATITAQQKKEAEESGMDGCGGPGDIQSKINLSGSAAKAAAKAAQHVHEAHGGGQGIGLDGQSNGGRNNPQAARKLFALMKNNNRFRKIMDIAGKMRQVLYAKQGAKLVRGAEEVVDIKLGNNLRHILPSELAKLNSPLHHMMMHRIMSGKALSRKRASIRPIGKGPIVVYLDESGSMDGSRDTKDPENTILANGKALALTMARMAMMQNRWCMLVGFSDSAEGNVCVLKPGQWDTDALMEWVQHFYCGGTTLDCALIRGPFGYDGVDDNGNTVHVKSYWEEYDVPRGKTDMLLISDGLVNVDPGVEERFNEWKKKEQCKMVSIIIDSDPGPIKNVSDQVWKISSLGVTSEAVAEMCSI